MNPRRRPLRAVHLTGPSQNDCVHNEIVNFGQSTGIGSIASVSMLPANKKIPLSWVDAIDNYLLWEASAGRPLTTIRLRRNHLQHIARSLDCPPQRVTTKQLTEWTGRQDWARETRRSYRSTLRVFFRFLHEVCDAADNPAADLPTITPEDPRPRPAPDHAWHTAITTADVRVALMLRLAAEAGLRRAEVSKVHVRDLRDGPSLLVHGKGARERTVPITETLAALIRQGAEGHTPGLSPSGWLFPSMDGDHLTPEYVGELVGRVLPDGYTMHTLRHRFATRAYRSSRNLRAVQILLGHQSIATTQRYLAVDDAEVRAAMLGAVA